MDKELKEIMNITESALEDDSLFIVDISVSRGKSPKVTILLDGDNGVSIDDCSRISRAVGHRIEEEDVIKSSYTLDVGSPGLDTPLKSYRQFKKNVGRKLKVKMSDGETIKGKLISCDENEIELVLSKKKSEEEKVNITYTEIDWAKVQVSFNNN